MPHMEWQIRDSDRTLAGVAAGGEPRIAFVWRAVVRLALGHQRWKTPIRTKLKGPTELPLTTKGAP